MEATMAFALPATRGQAKAIGESVLVHVAPLSRRDQIVQGGDDGPLPAHANCRIHLKAGQGWSVAPFRLLRDYSVFDPYLNRLKSWGRYTYFFIGPPGRWAMIKNIGPGLRWGDLGPELMSFHVAGQDLLACVDLLFVRPDDNVLVIRGDYAGPAWADPAP